MWALFIAIIAAVIFNARNAMPTEGIDKNAITHNCSSSDSNAKPDEVKCHSCFFCQFTKGEKCTAEDFERCPAAREEIEYNKCFLLKEFALNSKGEREGQTGIQKGCLHSFVPALQRVYICPSEQNPHPNNPPNITFDCCAGLNCNLGVSSREWAGYYWRYWISSLQLPVLQLLSHSIHF